MRPAHQPTPEQTARAQEEHNGSLHYNDGSPKLHRHFAEHTIHTDAECHQPSRQIRVYAFDAEDLDAHERFITARADAEARGHIVFDAGQPIVAGELIEDDDGAPLPHELQRGGRMWHAVREVLDLSLGGIVDTEVIDGDTEGILTALAPILWPLLPSNIARP